MSLAIHSRFNPAMMPAELLEQVFVQRQALAGRLAELIRESAQGASKHNVLIAGPRGIGKSHLVALVCHRVRAMEDLPDKLAIAWLPEDEWAISNYSDLLREIWKALGGDIRALAGVPPKAIEARAWELIRARLAGRTLLLVIENLDEVLSNLGDAGQRKWRALMQNEPVWTLLATTPALSADLTAHASPFYGFFEVHKLEELSGEEAIGLLLKMAVAQANVEMEEHLKTPAGRAKVRAVQHLAGGNPRVMVIFYQLLAEGIQGDLTTPVLKTVDALTPYYQSQMRTLSPQQRKIVDLLCRFEMSLNVGSIAEGCGITHQTASAQLKQLLQRRFVKVRREGRESFYELAEPLMRVSVEVKRQGPGLLAFVVELLRCWFTREELKALSAAGGTGAEYYRAADLMYDDAEKTHQLVQTWTEVGKELILRYWARGPEGLHEALVEQSELMRRMERWPGSTVAELLGRADDPDARTELESRRDPWIFLLPLLMLPLVADSFPTIKVLDAMEDALRASVFEPFVRMVRRVTLEEQPSFEDLPPNLAKLGQLLRDSVKNSRAAATVAAISTSECAAETKPASN